MYGYILTNGEGRYINKDGSKFVAIAAKNKAYVWCDKERAKNVLKCALPKKMQGQYKIEEISVDQPQPVSDGKYSFDYVPNDNVKQIRDKVEEVLRLASAAETRLKELKDDLSKVDREISDVNHYIEFNKLNAYQGYVACKLLQDKLLRRRGIKDEILVHTSMLGAKDAVETAHKAIVGLEHRVYAPRELTDLFSS